MRANPARAGTGAELMRRTVGVALLLASAGCSLIRCNVFHHDEDAANAVATEFLQGLAAGQYERSYAVLHPVVRAQMTSDQFADRDRKLQAALGRMESAVWDAFYPQPGQPLIGLHYLVRYAMRPDVEYYLLLRQEQGHYLIQYFVNGPKGKVQPKMVTQMRRPVNPPREVLGAR